MQGPSAAAASAAPGKRRRLSNRKADAALELLQQQQQEADVEAQISEMVEAFRRDHNLLVTCRSIMKRQAKRETIDRLPRGVRKLEDVSAYLVRTLLSEISGAGAAVFTNMDTNDCKVLLLWSLNCEPKYKVPQLEMKKEDFSLWVQD
eukprot:7170350-Lingulodinium_polyedra.AAC.1